MALRQWCAVAMLAAGRSGAALAASEERMGIEDLADRMVSFQGGATSETTRDDGKPHHCGIDLVTLYKLQGRWRIVGLADNRHASC